MCKCSCPQSHHTFFAPSWVITLIKRLSWSFFLAYSMSEWLLGWDLIFMSYSPHVRLVVLIGSTGENKGLVANILLVLIPEGKIYLKVQKWMVRSSLISSQLSKSLPARSILGLRRIVKRSNPCELPTFIARDRLLHIWKTCLFNFWKKWCWVLREYLCKHLNRFSMNKF